MGGGGWEGAALWVGYPEQGPTQCGDGLRGAGTNQGGQGNGEATRCVCFRAEDVTSERREAKLSALTNLLSMLADHTELYKAIPTHNPKKKAIPIVYDIASTGALRRCILHVAKASARTRCLCRVCELQVQLPFAASVSLLEGFAGLSDPASLATILGGIAPRTLLLLGGSAAASAQLAAACAGKLGKEATQILQPSKCYLQRVSVGQFDVGRGVVYCRGCMCSRKGFAAAAWRQCCCNCTIGGSMCGPTQQRSNTDSSTW